MTCPVCGTVAVPGAKFCHQCGSALAAVASLPAAERRIVTVLFGDLSDFTAWAEDLDPERVGAVTDRLLAALAGAVKTFGGHVDKLTGDGIMAVFGAPVAHEDDAERAVRAALSMQRAMRRLLDDERGGGAPLGLRVGLNTGPVVAGVQAAIEYTVVGDTVNTAARLADAAAIAAVYAGAPTVAGTRRVASWRALRPLRLKGKREPVEAYELLGLRDAPGTRSGLGDEAPFIGRDSELGRVAGRLMEVVDRREPKVLVFTGEAGLGKTRFAAEVERFAAGYAPSAGYAPAVGFAPGGGTRVLAVQCAAYGERRRLAPLADLVRAAIGLSAEHAAMTRPAVEERLRRLGQHIARASGGSKPRLAIDLLLTLIGYAGPVDDSDRGGWVAPGGEAQETELETMPAAVADLLSGLAAETPMLIVVDDLHDATAETVDALGATVSRMAGPVLIMLLGRPELVHTAGALTRLADAEIAPLAPLRGADAERLLTSYLQGGRLPRADMERLLATAQGNPFYLAELVALLQERGSLTTVISALGTEGGAPPTWRLAEGSLGGRLLSRDLAAVLAARIDALPPDARAVLRDAAVVGDTVPLDALETVSLHQVGRVGRPAVVATVELQRAIEELLQRRMLRKIRGGFVFATPLLREAAYAGIGKAALAERHAVLAHWAAGASTGSAGRFTAHSSVSGASVLGAVATGGHTIAPAPTTPALGMSFDAFIAEHANRAVTLADAVGLPPESPTRSAVSAGAAALSRLAGFALATGEPALAAGYAERAEYLSGGILSPADRLVHARALLQLGRTADALAYLEKISANAGDDAAVRADALLVAGRAYRAAGDRERAYSAWLEALEAATVADLSGDRAEALRRLGMIDYLAGRLAEASARFTEAYETALADGDRRSQAWSLQDLAWATTTRGDFVGADAALGRAARIFAELHDPVGRAWLRGTTAFVRLLAGRLVETQRLARVFLPFGERTGEAWAVGTLRAVAAFASAELGELAEADREARRAYRDFAEANDDWGRGLSLVVRGVAARGIAAYRHAYDLLSDATECAEQTRHPLLIGLARTMRGFVSLDLDDPRSAEADALAVLAVVEPHDAFDAARVGPLTLMSMARRVTGDLDTAIALLEPVAAVADAPGLVFPRRHAIAAFAAALLAAGRDEEAVTHARRAVTMSGEDVRSEVYTRRVLARALAAVGRTGEARATAQVAVNAAFATQQLSERVAAERVRDALSAR
ncbi:MAG: AAA family ATPase [Dactylosporangium sp.]|nr:AAA family ATPase [Dactylosporangium sp.]NNJ63252.1 AAA family ATPase [Dactylosporangium sp.]